MVKTSKRTRKNTLLFSNRISRRVWIRVLGAGFILYAVVAGFSGLRLSTEAVRHADPRYIVGGTLLIALSYGCAALTYKLISPRPLPFLPTLLVQIAGGLVNRMLPAGLGGMGLNAFYLKKQRLSLPLATAVVATNNLLGFLGNIVLIVVAFLLSSDSFRLSQLPKVPWQLIVGGIALLLIIALWLHRRSDLTQRLKHAAFEIKFYIHGLIQRPFNSLLALISSMLLTVLHIGGLLFVLAAVGVTVEWVTALLAISFGAFMGAAIPTPGGLGGAEAGITAVLIAGGVPLGTAVAVALIYRVLTYWLPLLPGYVALRIVEKRYLY